MSVCFGGLFLAGTLTRRLAVGPSFEPGGAVFAMYVLLVASSAAGEFVARFPPMPALVGQLVVGFLLRNLPIIGPAVGGAVDVRVSSSVRTAALGVILTRAGISLDLPAMWRLRWAASRLAFAPSTCEALVVTLVSKPLLVLPWTYAVVLGFLYAAISPAVVIPSLLSLHEKGFGAEAGVATLVVTAASVDVVYGIAGFGVASSLLFVGGGGGGGAVEAAWRAPVQLVVGVVGGGIVGTVLGVITSSYQYGERNDSCSYDGTSCSLSLGRAIGLLGVALAVLYAGAEIEATGGAALAVIVMSAAAARTWSSSQSQVYIDNIKRGNESGETDQEEATPKAVGAHLNVLWTRLAQPLLFALIGAAVDLTQLSGDVVGKGLLILFVGLVGRTIVAFLASGGGHLGFLDRVFIAVAWTPKATVQAALAGLPYDAAVTVYGKGSIEAERCEVILALGVLAIAVTAPLGAAAVAMSGERLLTRGGTKQQQNNNDEDVNDDVAAVAVVDAGADETGKEVHVQLS